MQRDGTGSRTATDELRRALRALRRSWWAAPGALAVAVTAIALSDGYFYWVWTLSWFAAGFALGVWLCRADTSRRFGARELQLEFYAAQDDRRLPERIHPPWWDTHIGAERRRLHLHLAREWIAIALGGGAALLLFAQRLIPEIELLSPGTLGVYILLCLCILAWDRLMIPALLADLDELASQLEDR
ncbi:hypothetical protein [Nocardia sp. NPDC020380]|uniref:hypothetical protein n=1 Tax=Nocardia sp. NPDC020380 TaxID=3364309 RepID=UPI0037B9CA13